MPNEKPMNNTTEQSTNSVIESLIDFAISAERDYMECDKMYLHIGRLKQMTGYNKLCCIAKENKQKPFSFQEYLSELRR